MVSKRGDEKSDAILAILGCRVNVTVPREDDAIVGICIEERPSKGPEDSSEPRSEAQHRMKSSRMEHGAVTKTRAQIALKY
jgi:hypothetical protein